jgi:hypothetical protein
MQTTFAAIPAGCPGRSADVGELPRSTRTFPAGNAGRISKTKASGSLLLFLLGLVSAVLFLRSRQMLISPSNQQKSLGPSTLDQITTLSR